MSHLKRLPAYALKIDKSFIAGLGEDVEDMAIVQMICDLAHTLGMEVLAEGWRTRGRQSNSKRWAATWHRTTTAQSRSLPKPYGSS